MKIYHHKRHCLIISPHPFSKATVHQLPENKSGHIKSSKTQYRPHPSRITRRQPSNKKIKILNLTGSPKSGHHIIACRETRQGLKQKNTKCCKAKNAAETINKNTKRTTQPKAQMNNLQSVGKKEKKHPKPVTNVTDQAEL